VFQEEFINKYKKLGLLGINSMIEGSALVSSYTRRPYARVIGDTIDEKTNLNLENVYTTEYGLSNPKKVTFTPPLTKEPAHDTRN
jgi:hypothetical protein